MRRAAACRFPPARSKAAAGGSLFEERLDLPARLGGVGLADQYVHAFDVELAELVLKFSTRFGAHRIAIVQQLEHRLLVGGVAEVALSIGSSVCVISFFTSPKRWMTLGAFI